MKEVLSVHHVQSLYGEEKELICCWCTFQASPPVKASSVTGDTSHFFNDEVDPLVALLPRKLVKPAFIQVVEVSLNPT